jgi:hypothetical protein
LEANLKEVTNCISLFLANAISVVPPPISTLTKLVALAYLLKKYCIGAADSVIQLVEPFPKYFS